MNQKDYIEIIPVQNKRQLKEFIYLPKLLHKDHIKWLPPIYTDEWNYYNPRKNKAYSYCDVELALCYYKNKPAGRIMGVINHRYNTLKGEKLARFSNLESINEQKVSNALLDHIERWAKSKGCNHIIGPFGMYYHDPIGFLIEGHAHEPSVSTYCNHEFIPSLIENAGYEKKYDLVAYQILLKDKIPEIFRRIRERIMRNTNIELITFRSKKEIKKVIIPMLELFNETYEEIDGYSQLDETEMKILAKQYLPILNPEFIKMAKVNNELAGFFIAMPNISAGIRSSGGKLFPFGIFKIVRALKTSSQLDLLLGGIKKKYQDMGIDALMAYDMLETAIRKKFRVIDSHLEMERNNKIRGAMEKAGGRVYKKYRLYRKAL